MKKNLRLVLLLALIVLMLGVTALVAAATGPAATDYFEVLDASGTHVGYYETATAASDAMSTATADTFTIKLLKDMTTTTAEKFNKTDKTYTFDGAGFTMNFTGIGTPGSFTAFTIGKGNVTIKNITIKTDQNLKYLINYSVANNFVLEDVVLEGGGTQILLNKACRVTIRGNNTVIGKNNDALASSCISLVNNSGWVTGTGNGRITIEAGRFEARSDLFDASGATIVITGGTFSSTSKAVFFNMSNNNFVSAVQITGGSFDLSNGGTFFMYTGNGDCTGFTENDNSVINISGNPTFLHSSTGTFITCTVSTVANKSTKGGTLYSNGGRPVIKIAGCTVNGWPDRPNDENVTRIQVRNTKSGETEFVNSTGDKYAIVTNATTGVLEYFDRAGEKHDITLNEASGEREYLDSDGAKRAIPVDEQGNFKTKVMTTYEWFVADRHYTGDAGLGTFGNDLIYLNKTCAILNISGGTFIGSPYTTALINTTTLTASPSEVNISGGTFIGAQSWASNDNASIWNFSGTCVFKEPAPVVYLLDLTPQQTKYSDVRAIWGKNNAGRLWNKSDIDSVTSEILLDSAGQPKAPTRATAGQFNFSGGTFTITYAEGIRLINAAGPDINISGGTFNIGAEGIAMADGDMISYVNITGGTFNGSGYGYILGYTGSVTSTGMAGQHGKLDISGGTFNTTESSVALRFGCGYGRRVNIDDAYVRISGGTFHSEGINLVYVNGASGEMLITGGTFDGTCPRLIILASYKGYVNIFGGTYYLSALADDKEAGRTDAIIQMLTSNDSILNVRGGTYINDRKGASQLVLISSKTAKIYMAGGKFLTRYEIPNFLERDLGHGSMPFNATTVTHETIEGVEYFGATIHAGNSDYSPQLQTDVTIRVTPDSPGIRFTTVMDKWKIDGITSAGGTVIGYGTLIMPQEYALQLTSFEDVHGQLNAMAQTAGVAASKVFADVAASQGISTDTDGNVTFRAALVGITDNNKGYGAVSYVKATVGGQTVYYYSGINTASNIVTLKSVAMRELDDISDRPTELNGGQYVYKYGSINDDGYSRYTGDEQRLMRRLAQ